MPLGRDRVKLVGSREAIAVFLVIAAAVRREVQLEPGEPVLAVDGRPFLPIFASGAPPIEQRRELWLDPQACRPKPPAGSLTARMKRA